MTSSSLRWSRQGAVTALANPDTAADWDRLNAARGNLPFHDAAALRNALEVFGSGGEQLLAGRAGGRSVAMFVLAPMGRLQWHTFQPSQLPLGAWVAEREQPLDGLAESLIRGPLGFCMVLSITQIDPRFAPRPADAPCLRSGDYIETGWLDIAGSFDDYWAARGKNLRQNMRKQRNRLAADGVTTRMQVLRSATEMAGALDRYGAMECASWKAGEGTAIHSGNAQGRFYRRLFEDAATRGEAVVYEYLFGGRTVAMNLCLLRQQQLIVLKTTYDESIKQMSPASLLREEELKSFFDGDDVRRIEYYGRLMDWHTKLTDEKRTLYHLTCYRWPWIRKIAERRSAQPSTQQAAPSAAVPEKPAAAAVPESTTAP